MAKRGEIPRVEGQAAAGGGRKRGDLTRKILEVAAELAAGATIGVAEAFLAVMVSPYGSSRGHIERRIERIHEGWAEGIDLPHEKAKFYKLVHKLREEGLLAPKGRGKFSATAKGKLHFMRLRERHAERLPPAEYRTEAGDADKLKIVIFDIPERERRKRAWLRGVLRGLDFTMLQKSVWTGTRRIPEDFLKDLADLRLVPHVEVFEVSKTGSLEKLL